MSFSLEGAQEAGQIVITTISNGGSLADAAQTLSQNPNKDIAAYGGAVATIASVILNPASGFGSLVNSIGIAAEVVNALIEFTDGEFNFNDVAAASGVFGAILARNPATLFPASILILVSLLPTMAGWIDGIPWNNDDKSGPSDAGGGAGGAGATPPRIDPLALDLNNNGIETLSAAEKILFDHNGDGIKTATGWLKPTDGWLVLDKNANGKIDSGAELFGVDTVKSNGQKATDAFDALKDLDANVDKKIDASDSVFNNLRVWQDLNQNGISEANELTSLFANNITAINLNSTPKNTNLGNGNIEASAATFIRTDGSSGELVEVSSSASALDLQNNPFYRQFPPITISDTAKNLPDMQASGAVRDLREAATLSSDLATALTNYKNQTTRAGQLAQLDNLLTAWANSSEMKTSRASVGVWDLEYLIPGLTRYNYTGTYYSPNAPTDSGNTGGGSGSNTGSIYTLPTAEELVAQAAEKQRISNFLINDETYDCQLMA